MSKRGVEDLRDRVVGKRFYNTEIEEAFTVVGVTGEGLLVLIQYDDGVGWDELAAPELLPDEKAEQVGVSTGGIDDSKYVQLGSGPKLAQACDEGGHDWYPRPAQLGWDDVDVWRSSVENNLVADTYLNVVRCRKCGLSGDVLSQFAGHETPTVCDRCGDEVIPGEQEIVFSPTPDWMDAFLCPGCAETVEEEFKPKAVECYKCELELGSWRENQPLFGNTGIGRRLGVEGGETFYLCNDCRDEVVEGNRSG